MEPRKTLTFKGKVKIRKEGRKSKVTKHTQRAKHECQELEMLVKPRICINRRVIDFIMEC